MAEDGVQIPIEVVLEDNSVKKAFVRLEKASLDAGKSASESLAKGFDLSKISANLAKFTAAAAAVGTGLLALGIKKAIDEAREGERVINGFNAALFSTGNFTKAASNQFVGYAESLEKTLGISKSVTLEGGKLLVTIGNLTGKGLERATDASLNLAAALGKDSRTGFELLSKAAAGQTEVLSRYGIKVDESIPKNQRFEAVLKLIETRFGGIAAVSNNTLDGALAKVSIQFGNIFENIGVLVTNSPVIIKAISLVSEAFASVADSFKNLDQLSFDTQVIGVLNYARSISDTLLPAIEVFVNVLVGVGKLGKFIFDDLVFIAARFSAVLGGALSLIGVISKETAAEMLEVSNAAGVVAQESADAAKAAFTNIFETETSTALNARLDGFIAKLNEVKGTSIGLKDQIKQDNNEIKSSVFSVSDAFGLVGTGIIQSAEEIRNSAEKNFKAMGKAMLQGIGQSAGQAFAAFGGAIATGQNALEAFGEALLKAFGGALVQLGTGFILQGIAQSFAGFGTGGPLIAAGAALAAFGGLLSASVGGGVPSASAAGGGIGADSGGGISNSPSPTTEIVETPASEPKPAINVVVNGNILDRRGSSLEIVELLQEAFDTQGARVTGLT